MQRTKKVHFFWGSQKLPFYNFLSILTFRKLHPEYQIHLYRSIDDDTNARWRTGEQGLQYQGRDYIEIARSYIDFEKTVDYSQFGLNNSIHPVHKADIIRQFLMYKVGGLWVDMDVIWINPLEKLLDDCDVTLVLHGQHSSGIVYSNGNSFYEHVFNSTIEAYDSNKYQCVGPDLLNRLYPTLESAEAAHPHLRFKNLPYHYFYPYHYSELDMLYHNYGDYKFSSETYCLHWFGGDGLSSQFRNLIECSNYLDFNRYSPIVRLLRALTEKDIISF
jgi:hypothetical protein